MTNPKAGHTSATGYGANSQGLRDGDGLTSPSLTNLYEGLHGNGIIRLGDGAAGDSLRNSIVTGTPGFVTVSSGGVVTINGGYCVLDGIMYKFANGPASTEAFTIGTSTNFSGDLPSVPSSSGEVFVVIYLVGRSSPEAHLMYEMGTPVTASAGTPLIPNRFLSDPSITANTDLNHNSTVLAVLRYTVTGGAANINASLSATATIFDRRTFLRNSPLYLTPMTDGAIGDVTTANAVNSAADLDGFFASPENGDFGGSPFAGIWHSHREDRSSGKHGVIYAGIPRNVHSTPSTETVVLGPNRISILTANVSFTFDQENVFLVNPNGGSADATLTPSGDFPSGHIIEVRNISTAGSFDTKFTAKTNNAAAAVVDITNGQYAKFVYDGTDWHLLFKG